MDILKFKVTVIFRYWSFLCGEELCPKMPSISFKKAYFGTENSVYLMWNWYWQTLLYVPSGILPVDAHAEVIILNLNYITALYFILLPLYCQIMCTTINNRGACSVFALKNECETDCLSSLEKARQLWKNVRLVLRQDILKYLVPIWDCIKSSLFKWYEVTPVTVSQMIQYHQFAQIKYVRKPPQSIVTWILISSPEILIFKYC